MVNPPLLLFLIFTLAVGYAFGVYRREPTATPAAVAVSRVAAYNGTLGRVGKLRSLSGGGEASGRTWLDHVDSLDPEVSAIAKDISAGANAADRRDSRLSRSGRSATSTSGRTRP